MSTCMDSHIHVTVIWESHAPLPLVIHISAHKFCNMVREGCFIVNFICYFIKSVPKVWSTKYECVSSHNTSDICSFHCVGVGCAVSMLANIPCRPDSLM